MPKVAVINSNPLCRVDLAPIDVAGVRTSGVCVRLEHPDTHEMVPIDTNAAHHSTSYQLISNEMVNNALSNVFARTGMAARPLGSHRMSKSAAYDWDGRRWNAYYVLDGINRQVNGNNMRLGVRAYNSYASETGAGVAFFLMAMECLNQFHMGNMLSGFFMKHQQRAGSNLEIDLADATERMAERISQLDTIMPKLEEMSQFPVERLAAHKEDGALGGLLGLRQQLVGIGAWRPAYDSDLLDELAHVGPTSDLLKDGEGLHENFRVLLRGDSSNHHSLWGALNAFTAVTTHRIGGFPGAAMSEKITEHCLGLVS